MPILVLAARLCPEGVEATLFATLMSILNGGSFMGSALGAALTSTLGVTSSDFSNMFLLVSICVMSTLLPAPFLGLLPPNIDQDPPEGGSGSNAKSSSTSAAAGREVPQEHVSLAKKVSRVELTVVDNGVDTGVVSRLGQQMQQRHGPELKR